MLQKGSLLAASESNHIILLPPQTLDWFFHINSPSQIFKAQPTYFLSEWFFVIIAFNALVHGDSTHFLCVSFSSSTQSSSN